MVTARPPSARRHATHPIDTSRSLLLIAVALFGVSASPAAAQDRSASPQASPRTQDGPAYPISQFVIRYTKEHPEHPPLDDWLPVEVELSRKDGRYTAAREGLPRETVSIDRSAAALRVYHASAIASVCQQLVVALQERGLIGLYVGPHPADIDPATEADQRRPGDTVLRLMVSTGQLRRIRTIALGYAEEGESRIDRRFHRHIRTRSPLQPPEDARDDTTDLLNKKDLEEYLHYLNRHPGRYVEAALAPGPDGDGVDLDFRINEAKPWHVYIQSSNTGTAHTATWQNRVGFIHRQFTGRDDILTIDYMNAGVDKVHSVNFSYEAPWFRPERPNWWKKSGYEPSWIAWFNRDRMPWWGVERLRWQVTGSFTQFEATGLLNSGVQDDFGGFAFDNSDWSAGGSLSYNFFQRGNLFGDLVAGLRVRGVEAMSRETRNLAKSILVFPSVALRLERQMELSGLFVELGFEANVNPVDDPGNLGRGGADDTWKLLTWNAVASHYLEPLLFPGAWRDTSTPLSSTLAHELYLSARGQYAFGHRLISQATQVIGGLYSVRGYPQSTATGDDVYIGTIEYRFHLANALPLRHSPVQLPWLGAFRWTRQQPYGRADWDLVLRLFWDAAYTRQSSSDSDLAANDVNQFLTGAGIGVEFSIKSYLRLRVDYAWALRDSKDNLEPVRAGSNEIYLHFSIFY